MAHQQERDTTPGGPVVWEFAQLVSLTFGFQLSGTGATTGNIQLATPLVINNAGGFFTPAAVSGTGTGGFLGSSVSGALASGGILSYGNVLAVFSPSSGVLSFADFAGHTVSGLMWSARAISGQEVSRSYSVPEPTSGLMLGLGLTAALALPAYLRRRSR